MRVLSGGARCDDAAVAEIVSLREGVAGLVRDGDVVAMEGFTHLIPVAAGHEVIRQGRRGLTLIRMTPDIVYDQLIGMGCARKLVFSWGGNPGVGSLRRFRDAVENGWPAPLELEEHSHAGIATAYAAGAANLPFGTLRGYEGTDLPPHTAVRWIDCPFTGERLAAVRALRPDVGIVHAQRADRRGNVQLWGITGVQKETVLASRRSLVTVEEVVDRLDRRPGDVVIPGWVVDCVSEAPGGAHPSYAHGYYDRDNDFYVAWDAIAADRDRFLDWMREHVLPGRQREAASRGGGPGEPGGSRGQHFGRGMTDAADYTQDEMMAVAAARRVGDQTVFVGIGLPSRAANLARATHAPGCTLIYESGTIGAKPARLPLSIGDGELAETADTVVSVPEMFAYWIQGGRIDLAFLGAAQIDSFGNLNSTVIGDYDHPRVRLPGAGGAPEIAAHCKQTLVVLRQSARSFVRELDFCTTVGKGRVSAVITDLGVLEPDASGELVLAALHPGATVEQAQAATAWELRVADGLETTEPPTPVELSALRSLRTATKDVTG
jgi:glutaconate CoA-transferase subunit A